MKRTRFLNQRRDERKMSKIAKEIVKEAIAKLVKTGESYFLWDKNFDLKKVARKLEFRGRKGEDFWKDELLELVLIPFRGHVKKQRYDEIKVDSDLQFLAEKIDVELDRIRKQFYAFELEQPTKEPTEEEEPEQPEEEGEEA